MDPDKWPEISSREDDQARLDYDRVVTAVAEMCTDLPPDATRALGLVGAKMQARVRKRKRDPCLAGASPDHGRMHEEALNLLQPLVEVQPAGLAALSRRERGLGVVEIAYALHRLTARIAHPVHAIQTCLSEVAHSYSFDTGYAMGMPREPRGHVVTSVTTACIDAVYGCANVLTTSAGVINARRKAMAAITSVAPWLTEDMFMRTCARYTVWYYRFSTAAPGVPLLPSLAGNLPVLLPRMPPIALPAPAPMPVTTAPVSTGVLADTAAMAVVSTPTVAVATAAPTPPAVLVALPPAAHRAGTIEQADRLLRRKKRARIVLVPPKQ